MSDEKNLSRLLVEPDLNALGTKLMRALELHYCDHWLLTDRADDLFLQILYLCNFQVPE